MKKPAEWVPNTDRLVRSAMSDERYCALILDCLHNEQFAMTLDQLQDMWVRAASSNDTVEEFIRNERN